MIKQLEEILYEKTKDKQSEILFAHWNYDKKVIPSALNAIYHLFPHYSLHDESHSIAIINNIVRILGLENIYKLSAIDIWLILEASYNHDIGMVVEGKELIETFESEDFLIFFDNLIKDEKNGLHEFASQFELSAGKIKYKNELFNIELYDGIKFIIAEYFRKNHSLRSKEIINNPLKISLTSPRGLIPPRIFKLLGDICANHTNKFDDVMNLPFREVGIGLDDAHPRFIACLLRIGDLLDLDNNRFSEIMLKTLTKIPIDTLNHKSKHLSIESFRADRELIEVSAKCKNYDTAIITQHWFNYLNSEISQQMTHWNIIVPDKNLGFLPSMGTLKVELLGYEVIDGKNKPKFTINPDRALELFQGAGIYKNSFQCIREILQNATDATLLRIWLENSNNKDFFTRPNNEKFREIVKNYPIVVRIKEGSINGDLKNWMIEIEDKGIGISIDDLNFLMNTGSSSKNKLKNRTINLMPLWMQPSGDFGIGFQSIFMLTDSVKIETKSFFTEKYQILKLNAPNSPKAGDILIQKKKSDHSIKPGTKILFNYETKVIPDSISWNMLHPETNQIIDEYDPFLNTSLDAYIGEIKDEILNFSNKSYIPIKLFIDEQEITPKESNFKKFAFFEEKNSLEFNIYPNPPTKSSEMGTYFKNQPVKYDRLFKFISLEVNIHKDKASEVLTLNRNNINPNYKTTLIKQISESAFEVITTNFDEIFKEEQEKQIGSMFLETGYKGRNIETNMNKLFNYWQYFKIKTTSGDEIELKKLMDSIETLKLVQNHKDHDFRWEDTYELKEKGLTINLIGNSVCYDYTSFFINKVSEIFTAVTECPKYDDNNKTYTVCFSKQNQADTINKGWLKIILKDFLKNHSTWRKIIPCLKEFLLLRIQDDAFIPYTSTYKFVEIFPIKYSKMVLPYIIKKTETGKNEFKICINEKLYEWVYNNRYDKNITKEEIIKAYNKFTEEFSLDELNK